MKPGLAALIVFASSLAVYGVFRTLLNAEVAAVALATVPALITIWLQRFRSIGEVAAPSPEYVRSSFSNWQVAALFAVTVVAVWALALLFAAAFNTALTDLITGGFIRGSTEAFNHLQFYVFGLCILFMWLPLLCVFGGYIGPRSANGAFWPYLVGLVVTLFAFLAMRFTFVAGSYQETITALDQVINLDLGTVEGGRFLALAAVISGFIVVLMLFSGMPWLVARTRRRLVLGKKNRSKTD